MQFTVLSMAAASFFLILAVLYPVGKRIDKRQRRLGLISRQEKNYLNDEMKLPFAQRFFAPVFKKFLTPLAAHNLFRPKNGKQESKLSRSLKMAGFEVSPGEFTAGKSVLQLLLVGTSILIAVRAAAKQEQKLLIVLAGILLAVLIPSYFLKTKIKARQSAIRNEMPSVMDLLVVSVEAGLGFDGAILQLYDKKRSSPLLQELARSVHDIQMGLSRRNVLKEMGERNDVQELKVLASSLIQAEQLGVSVKNVLVSQAEQLRVERRQRIEAKALKAPVKMMLPTVMFIFPVMFIILLAPAFLKIKDIF